MSGLNEELKKINEELKKREIAISYLLDCYAGLECECYDKFCVVKMLRIRLEKEQRKVITLGWPLCAKALVEAERLKLKIEEEQKAYNLLVIEKEKAEIALKLISGYDDRKIEKEVFIRNRWDRE